MSEQIKTVSGEVLELKEGVVLNEDGSEAERSSRNWLLGLRPGQWAAGIVAAFAIPAVFLFGLLLIGGFFSLIALFVILQPFFGGKLKVQRGPGA
ncbi:MAG TPA: hypothetical protein VM598_13610 [Bdellovibrionota bacterium]|nr:hypothetical protein [Bdellovibrionota bacterium]